MAISADPTTVAGLSMPETSELGYETIDLGYDTRRQDCQIDSVNLKSVGK